MGRTSRSPLAYHTESWWPISALLITPAPTRPRSTLMAAKANDAKVPRLCGAKVFGQIRVWLICNFVHQTIARLAKKVGVDAHDSKFGRTALHWAAEACRCRDQQWVIQRTVLGRWALLHVIAKHWPSLSCDIFPVPK